MDFQRQTAILATATSTVQDTLNLSKAITEYGVLVVIAAVFLIVTIFIFKRMIDSYAKTVDGIIPKLEETSKSINDLKISINELMSAHNAHTNQSLRGLERDTKDIREELSHYQKTLMDLDGALTSLQENYNTLLKIIIHSTGYRRMLSDSTIEEEYDDRVVRVDQRSYHETVEDVDAEGTHKKDGDESD